MVYKRPPNVRDVTPILKRIRNWLLSHDETILAHRYEGHIAKRTQPQPNLPPGVSNKLSANYYCTRDARRESRPPVSIFDASRGLLTAGETPAAKSSIKPGFSYNWDTGKFENDKK